jgi:hypothetical protein
MNIEVQLLSSDPVEHRRELHTYCLPTAAARVAQKHSDIAPDAEQPALVGSEALDQLEFFEVVGVAMMRSLDHFGFFDSRRRVDKRAGSAADDADGTTLRTRDGYDLVARVFGFLRSAAFVIGCGCGHRSPAT